MKRIEEKLLSVRVIRLGELYRELVKNQLDLGSYTPVGTALQGSSYTKGIPSPYRIK